MTSTGQVLLFLLTTSCFYPFIFEKNMSSSLRTLEKNLIDLDRDIAETKDSLAVLTHKRKATEDELDVRRQKRKKHNQEYVSHMTEVKEKEIEWTLKRL